MIATYKKSNFRLLLTMILVSLMVTGLAITVIYHITLKNKKEYLSHLADKESDILLTLYRQTGDPDQVLETIALQQSLHPGLGETGEFVLSSEEGDSIQLLYYSGIPADRKPLSLALKESKGKTSLYAASGRKGFMKGLDYRGIKVLAYGEYIRELEWGLVAKVDFTEITGPFREASLLAIISSLILVLTGVYLFRRFSDPLLERILENEKKYHMLFELIPYGVNIANINGEIIESNQESERLLGIPRDSRSKLKIDSSDWKIIRLDGSPMPVSEFASTKALSENRVVTNVEMGIVKEDGKVTWLNVSASPFPVMDLGIIVVYSDISRRVMAEMKLVEHDHRMEEMVRQLNVLNDTKDKFFNIIAHDLKNPFGSLLGASEYLYKEIDKHDVKKAQKLSKILYDSSKNAYDILANLLEWSRSQSGLLDFHPTRINLYEIAAKNVQLAAAQASEKEISIKLNLEEEFECDADPNMLNTILRNLLTNAIKFTPAGGKVTIKASRHDNEAVIAVRDTGNGIPAEDIPKLFRIDEKYVNTGTNNEKGTGLGLILCREFVEYHGGEIWVESQLNEGSTFYFTIPGGQG